MKKKQKKNVTNQKRAQHLFKDIYYIILMAGGLMQLIAYGAQDIHFIELFRYYKQILELKVLTNVIIRNKDDSINVEYTEKVNNIINTIRKKYPKLSVETMRDIIVLYIQYTIDCHYRDHNKNLFYLISIKDKDIMNYINKSPWFMLNDEYKLALGCPDYYDYYHKHLDNNIKGEQYSDEEYETDEEY